MKKVISIFTLIVILSVLALSLFAPAGALASAADKNQVTESTGIRLYGKDGRLVNGTQLGQNDSVVSVKKTAQQYVVNGVAQENKFLVELEVRTTQDLLKLSSSSPDAAVTLILDLSSSMTECVNCGHKEDEDCHENRPGSSQNR